MKLEDLRIFDWQYYWQYKILGDLESKNSHDWAFYSLWVVNMLFVVGSLFAVNTFYAPLKQVYERGEWSYIALNAATVVVSFLITRLIYGNLDHRTRVVNLIESNTVEKPYKWSAITFPIVGGGFCCLSFYLDGIINY